MFRGPCNLRRRPLWASVPRLSLGSHIWGCFRFYVCGSCVYLPRAVWMGFLAGWTRHEMMVLSAGMSSDALVAVAIWYIRDRNLCAQMFFPLKITRKVLNLVHRTICDVAQLFTVAYFTLPLTGQHSVLLPLTAANHERLRSTGVESISKNQYSGRAN